MNIKDIYTNSFTKKVLDFILDFFRKIISAEDENHMLFYYKDHEIKYMDLGEMINYARDHYIDKEIESINKKAFLKDLALFKSFRTEIELEIKDRSEFFSYLSMFLVILSIIMTSDKVSEEIYKKMSEIVGYIAIGLLLYILYRFSFHKIDPKFKKYQTVNYIINNLEFRKEDIDKKTIEIPEIKKFERNIMKKNIFEPYCIEADEKGVISYKDSNDKKNDLTTKSKEDLAKYINDRYCNVNEQSREDILKDLAVFKNLRKTLELEYRRYEAFIKNVAFIIAILSFAITSTKDLIKLNIPAWLVLVILVVSLVYLLGTGIYLVKIVDRKNGPGKLDVVEYGIIVLEMKLKELDRK